MQAGGALCQAAGEIPWRSALRPPPPEVIGGKEVGGFDNEHLVPPSVMFAIRSWVR